MAHQQPSADSKGMDQGSPKQGDGKPTSDPSNQAGVVPRTTPHHANPDMAEQGRGVQQGTGGIKDL